MTVKPSKIEMHRDLDVFRGPGGFFDVEPNEMDLDAGRLVRFKGGAESPYKIMRQLHRVICTQKDYRGEVVYRVVSVEYNDTFGRCMKREDAVFEEERP